MTSDDATAGERSAALDGWVAAFDREVAESSDFARSVSRMTEHGCFDVRAVVERWILANPSGDEPVACAQPPLEEAAPAAPVLEEAGFPRELTVDAAQLLPRIAAGSSPDIAYFHNLLQGGIERGQIYEAFPEFRLVIDQAFGQYEASAPILSDAARGPTREDLNEEIRGMRQELQARRPERRRWRRD